MYGSQTGNAQSIAEGVHDGCQKRGLESTLLKCDAWKKVTNRSVCLAWPLSGSTLLKCAAWKMVVIQLSVWLGSA